MDAVIKVGGSLLENPSALRSLCAALGSLPEQYEIIVVPGGGQFADLVRIVDKEYSLYPTIAHKMAILGMDQYGFLLSQLIPNSLTIKTLKEAFAAMRSRKIAVFLPSNLMFEVDPLEPSWNVTSDSIAAYIADQLRAKKLVLVTDVDGIFNVDPKKDLEARLFRTVSLANLLKKNQRTSIDIFVPQLLMKTNQDCYVVNGKYPERIERILSNKRTICTRILLDPQFPRKQKLQK